MFDSYPLDGDPRLQPVHEGYRTDEEASVADLLAEAAVSARAEQRIAGRARDLVLHMRERAGRAGGIDAFLAEYGLDTREGVVLMCLAEALLRIPDAETARRLIRERLNEADWEAHVGHSESLLVNASTYALMLSGRMLDGGDEPLAGVLDRVLARSGEPVIRRAVIQAMRILGRQFVLGDSIEEALDRAKPLEARGYRYSYDMLGEAARTMADADRYQAAYDHAITAIGEVVRGRDLIQAPSLSVKLSALHPRFEFAQMDRVVSELLPRVRRLALAAREAGIAMSLDAEEADRLLPYLAVVRHLAEDPALAGWDGLGVVIQAYQKRAPAVIDWLADLARRTERRLPVRLVKGAYWDFEIKRAQELGLSGYPVHTRKSATDVGYVVCARRLLAAPEAFYPQFATHNARTLATVTELARGRRDYEFQRLHGMGESLYEQIAADQGDYRDIACRIYAPVGPHHDLLPYLVRRLLENGANTSFVNRVAEKSVPVDRVIADPVKILTAAAPKAHPAVPLPRDLYLPERRNSEGLDLSDPLVVSALEADLSRAWAREWMARPVIAGQATTGAEGPRPVHNPADRRQVIGQVVEADCDQVSAAVAAARSAAAAWDARPADARAGILERAADLYEGRRADLIALIVREAGRTLPDAVAEVREAVDFLRYYAALARRDFAAPVDLRGPTGEDNRLSLHGRGVFACISPWNFPVAIFTGQVAAALAAGNAVVAKPAEQTPLAGALAVALLHEAGVPAPALNLVPGAGETVGRTLVAHPGIDGVAFTGSVAAARAINRTLAERDGPILPLIAETGGLNAMIVDSSALTEQVVRDTVISAFHSAGQRCSALRVLCLQEDIADTTLDMLAGAVAELKVGDPALLATDVGPVIDGEALGALEAHARTVAAQGRMVAEARLGPACTHGTFCAPRVVEINDLRPLAEEVFGPILHVLRYPAGDLDHMVEAIRASGYGLTLGIHSRIDSTVARIRARLPVGNVYVNRNMIGAVVGVQPFGGEGLSGTGPKAGGPRYLYRFANERCVSIDTTASGGNVDLLAALHEDP